MRGERNTKFFHTVTAVKRRKSKNFRVQNMHGVWVSDQKEIAEAGVEFFKDLFCSFQQSFDFSLIQKSIPRLITSD